MRPDPSQDDNATLFRRLANRDAEAFGELCRRFLDKLRAFARYRLRNQPELDPLYDEEDAVISGLNLLWERLMRNKLVPPDSLDDFLRLARTLIARRITARVRRLNAKMRRPGANGTTGRDLSFDGPHVPDDLDLYVCDLPPPDVSTIAKDEVEWLMSLLGKKWRAIAELRWEGKTVDEIVVIRRKPRRTIERMFQQIHEIWTKAQRDS
jgi:DNA-directed RNA polymerase specialized sigma24 family protein